MAQHAQAPGMMAMAPPGKAVVEARIVKPEEREFQDIVALGIFTVTMFLSLIFGIIGSANRVGPQGILDLIAKCQGLPEGFYQLDTPSADSVSISGADENGFQMMEKDPGIAIGVIFAAFAIALVWLLLLRQYTRVMVWGTLLASAGMLLIGAGYAFAYGLTQLGLVFLAVVAIEGIFLAIVRKSVNVCADMLQLACQALMHYPSILVSHALLGLSVLVATVLTFVFIVSTEFNIVAAEGPTCTELRRADYTGTFQVWNWFSLMWYVGTIAGVRLFVSAFVAGQWYFHRDGDRVENATIKALLLAFSKSLGTLAIAGVITALVNWAKRKVRKMKRSCNPCMCLLAYMLNCLLQMVEFLNTFATLVATVTGKSFFGAAAVCPALLKDTFVGGFVTNRYARLVLEIGSVAISVVVGLITWAAFDSANNLESTGEIGWNILYIILALWQPWGLVLGFIFAFFLEGSIALVGLAAVIAGVTRFVLLFLVNTLMDITNAMFTFYAIDLANATVSGEHGAKLHGTVGTFLTATEQTAKPIPTGPMQMGVPTAQAGQMQFQGGQAMQPQYAQGGQPMQPQYAQGGQPMQPQYAQGGQMVVTNPAAQAMGSPAPTPEPNGQGKNVV